MYSIYTEQCNLYNTVNVNSVNNTGDGMWCNSIKCILNNLGFGNIFLEFNAGGNYARMVFQRLRDQYVQEWHDALINQPKMEYYRMFKHDFKYEIYLDSIASIKLRQQLSRFRLCSHSLDIETGRH